MKIEQSVEELLSLYNEIKREIKNKHPYWYERWKAGGFLVDNDIVSMYPCLENVLELEEEEEESEEDEESEEGEDEDSED